MIKYFLIDKYIKREITRIYVQYCNLDKNKSLLIVNINYTDSYTYIIFLNLFADKKLQ